MKKKHALLSIVGAAVISSCAYYGQEINDDARIVELENAINDKMKSVENYEAVMKYHLFDQYDGSENTGYDAETVYRIDKDSQCCLLVSAEQDKKKTSIALYSVNDAEYGWVTYREVTPFEGEPYAEFAYRRDIPFNFVTPQISAPALGFFANVFYPQSIGREITPKFVNNSFKFYSKGEGNLTIEGVLEGEDSSSSAKNYIRSTYNNCIFESAKKEAKLKTSNHTKEETIEIKFKKLDSLSISLPKDWKDKIKGYGIKA